MNKELILTRYLYSKKQVKRSLLISLLENKRKEALFWAYEIYFSGFEDSVFKYLLKIYNTFYKMENNTLEAFIVKMIDEWKADNTKHHLLSSIVVTMASREYRIDEYVNMCDDVWCEHVVRHNGVSLPKYNLHMQPSDVEEYRHIETSNTKKWKVLDTACVYPIRNNVDTMFGYKRPDDLENIYNSNRWLYYAWRSPVWMKRVEEFRGRSDDDKGEIVFPDEDAEDDFFDKWGYETDELPAIVKWKIMGDANVMQITLDAFCNLYGGRILRNELIITK